MGPSSIFLGWLRKPLCTLGLRESSAGRLSEVCDENVVLLACFDINEAILSMGAIIVGGDKLRGTGSARTATWVVPRIASSQTLWRLAIASVRRHGTSQ